VGRLLYEVKRVIVGQDHMLERILVGVLARGHLLVEGVPGLAKTLAIKTVASAVHGEFKRIQFTPDLVPADLVGTRIYNQKTGEFQTSLGPVFTNLLLADEINRAPAKVQSALLEAMGERQVTIGRESHKLPDPFLVMATQNPIETEGTYALPEAQVDRFMMKVVVGYPNEMDEFLVVERMAQGLASVSAVMTTERLLQLQRETDRVFVDPVLMEYVVRLSTATRRPSEYGLPEIKKYITYGASPRASINLILTGRALAFMRGRTYVLAQDILDLVHDVLRHRLVLSYEALSDNVAPEQLIDRVLQKVPVPTQALQERVSSKA
jgi:MoxR-like ATPase